MIYLDNAATTKVDEDVAEIMMKYYIKEYGNPSGIYKAGATAMIDMESAKHDIAVSIGADDNEIFFTSGATESNNWALIGAFEAFTEKGKHIITSKIEHESILSTCRYLEKYRGAEVTYLDVDEYGFIDIKELEAAIRKDTILVSIMHVNNEIGVIAPIKDIAKVVKAKNCIFHTDCVQSYTKEPINVKDMGIDMLSVSAHKIHGAKGVGFLYIRNGIKLRSFIHGGHQQNKRRAGTENVAGIVGMAMAGVKGIANMESNNNYIKGLRDYALDEILRCISGVKLNGSLENRISGNINVSFDGIDAENVVIALDMKGIAVSTGSACTSGSTEPSHVLKAMGLDFARIRSALRISIDKYNTKEEIDKFIINLKEIIHIQRRMLT